MGLLERALKYKKELNESGKETLIDKIIGPAETEFMPGQIEASQKIAFEEIDSFNEDKQKNTETAFELDQLEKIKETTKGPRIRFADDETVDSEIKGSILMESEEIEEATPPTIEKIQQNFEEKSAELFAEAIHDSNEIIESLDIESLDSKDDYDRDISLTEFNDYAVLYEILKEFLQAGTIEDIYNSLIFSIMGQLGVSSVSILRASEKDPSKWKITQSNGIKIPEEEILWEVSSGILEILNSYRGVLDVEDLKDDVNLREDYYRFTSVNGRLLVPVIHNDDLIGAILIGEKIDDETFTPQEIDFLQSLSDAVSIALLSKGTEEQINTELLALRIEKEILFDVEYFQNEILEVKGIDDLKLKLKKNLYSLGLESYGVFLKDRVTGDFYPFFCDEVNSLDLKDSGFIIKRDNRFAIFLANKKKSVILEDFFESSVIAETFGKNRMEKMEIFLAYPFIMNDDLLGFVNIFKINPAVEIKDVDIRLQRIVKFLIPYLHNIDETLPESRIYQDLFGEFFNRLEFELKKARESTIPLTIASISIKNYRRFYERFGKVETKKLLEEIPAFIKERLSPSDFFVRIDRGRFIIVLPGKDKKFAITLCSVIKNSITSRFNTADFKLLLSFIPATFPEDGKDSYTLLDLMD